MRKETAVWSRSFRSDTGFTQEGRFHVFHLEGTVVRENPTGSERDGRETVLLQVPEGLYMPGLTAGCREAEVLLPREFHRGSDGMPEAGTRLAVAGDLEQGPNGKPRILAERAVCLGGPGAEGDLCPGLVIAAKRVRTGGGEMISLPVAELLTGLVIPEPLRTSGPSFAFRLQIPLPGDDPEPEWEEWQAEVIGPAARTLSLVLRKGALICATGVLEGIETAERKVQISACSILRYSSRGAGSAREFSQSAGERTA